METLNKGILESASEGLNVIIPTKESRPVRFKDLWRVLKDGARIKLAMLRPFPGKYEKAASVSHCQIEGNDPLRFFVVDRNWGWHYGNKLLPIRTVINPKIVWHGAMEIKSKEGCMSYPYQKLTPIKRWQIVEMEYQTFFGKRKRKFYEMRAVQCQHELDHMNNITIFDRYRHKVK